MKKCFSCKTLFVLGCIIFSSFAADMVLTTQDGIKFTLHPDSTWVVQDKPNTVVEKDFTVPVKGYFVLISRDGTWRFTKKEIQEKKILTVPDSVVGNGHAMNANVTIAEEQAAKKALEQITLNTKTALSKAELAKAKYPDCFTRAEKKLIKNTEFISGKGWDVSVHMKITKETLLDIVACAAMPLDDTVSTDTKKSLIE